MEDQNKTW